MSPSWRFTTRSEDQPYVLRRGRTVAINRLGPYPPRRRVIAPVEPQYQPPPIAVVPVPAPYQAPIIDPVIDPPVLLPNNHAPADPPLQAGIDGQGNEGPNAAPEQLPAAPTLMGLPSEVRNRIWLLAFRDQVPLHHRRWGFCRYNPTLAPQTLAPLLLNRQTRREQVRPAFGNVWFPLPA